ncbi:MAG: gamma-glutamyltransferase, partial [Planctomycetota bacterium]
RIGGRPFATRSEVIARHGMAATSQPLATLVAIDVLKAGGGAVDAAIAANAVLALTEPTGCGLGGDLFAIVWDAKEGRLRGLNASGRSPRALTYAQLEAELARLRVDAIPKFGPLPVSVPGCVDGWFELHDRFGKLPFHRLMEPAIAYAREGFPVSEVIAYYWGRNAKVLAGWPGFAETFMPGGKAPTKGEIFRNPALADTLEKIAQGGRDEFYRGDIAQTIGAYVKRCGGYLAAEDLAAHRSTWDEPVSTNYRGYDVWELPPNGQGIAALQILNILEGYDLRSMGFGSAAHVHHFVEAKKLAFADRARFYADPAFADVPVARLISKEYAAERRGRLDPRRAATQVPPGNVSLDQGDTIYLTVADREGNMVSLIQSNYRGMGSGMTPDGLGFVLQDRGELFAMEPGHPNVYAPGKRPFHTIIPAFITRNGKPWVSFGVMGGGVQPQMHAQIVMNLVDFDMNLQEAGDAPRIDHSGSSEPTGGPPMADGGRVNLETGLAEVAAALRALGHGIGDDKGLFGGYQAILRDPETGVYYGASESRKDGMAAGF